MTKSDMLRLDGILWHIPLYGQPEPLCPSHHLRLKYQWGSDMKLYCLECDNTYLLPREISTEIEYIQDKIASKSFKAMSVINLDDEAIPLAEDKVKTADNEYFVTAKLIKSKVGHRLIVYAGKQGNPKKTQIFVEPDIGRLAFDQKDEHPTTVFAKVEATFKDGTRMIIDDSGNPKGIKE